MRSLHGKDTKERSPTAIGPETIRERFTVGHMAYRPGGYLKAGTGCMMESLCPRDDGGNGDAAAGFRKPGKRGDYDSERKLNQNEAGNNCRNGFVHHGTGDAVHFARHMVDHCGKMENKGREWAFQELRGSSSCTGCGVFRYRNGSYMDEPVKETEDWLCKAGCKEIMDSLSRPDGFAVLSGDSSACSSGISGLQPDSVPVLRSGAHGSRSGQRGGKRKFSD